MAIYYLDLLNGLDANNGLTAGTPKKTLNAACALVTAVTDEVRVRGTDGLYTDLSGTWTWTKGSNNVVCTGADYTAQAPAGTWICKKTTGVPHFYLVASITYAGGNTTIVLTAGGNSSTYQGSTETIATSKLVVTASTGAQILGKNGFQTGTAASWNRVDTLITGGWDATYTSQTSLTLLYNTTSNSGSVVNSDSNTRLYWHLQRFVIFNQNQYYNINTQYCHYTDCSIIGRAAGRYMINIDTWSIYNNCYFYQNATSASYYAIYQDVYSKFIDCTFHSNTATPISYLCNNNNFTTTKFNNSIIANQLDYFYNCEFNIVNQAITLSVQQMSGNTFQATTGLLSITSANNLSGINYSGTTAGIRISAPSLVGCKISGTTYTLDNRSAVVNQVFSGNTIKASGLVTFLNQQAPISHQQPMVVDNVWKNAVVNNSKGYFRNNAGLKLPTSAQLYPDTIIYDTTNEIDKSKWSGFLGAYTGQQQYTPALSIPVIASSGNSILFNGGYLQLTDDAYSGSTALQYVNNINSATNSVFRLVDFNVTSGATGYLSAWIRGNGVTLDYNIMNDGKFIWNNWKTTLSNNIYQNLRANISGSTFTKTGTATLWGRIPSKAAGTTISFDNIGIYSGTTTDSNIYIIVYPTVTTQANTNVSYTSLTANGNVTASGSTAIIERGFVYSHTNSTPTIADSKKIVAGTTGAYSASITGLTDNSIYYVRAYAANSDGVSYGTVVNSTTIQIILPVVVTSGNTNIYFNNFTATGKITTLGNSTIVERGFVYGTSSNPTKADNYVIISGVDTNNFTAEITGLTSNTTYYMRTYVIYNINSVTSTIYGNEVSSTTIDDTGSGYLLHKTITIDSTKVSGGADLTDFTVYVESPYSYTYDVNSYDVLFTDINGNTLNHQLISYDNNGLLKSWVKVPVLSYSANTVINLYTYNLTANTNTNTSAVWGADVQAQYGLDNASLVDGTGYANGVATGSPTYPQGKIYNSFDAVAGSQYVTVSGNSRITIGNSDDFTVSCWVNLGTLSGFVDKKIIGNTQTSSFYKMQLKGNSPNYKFSFEFPSGVGNQNITTGTTAVSNTWYHFAAVYDRANGNMWNVINGVQESFKNIGSTVLTNNNVTYIGKAVDGAMSGYVDEVRIYKVVKTTGWLATEYNNQNSPQTFYTITAFDCTPTVLEDFAAIAMGSSYGYAYWSNSPNYTYLVYANDVYKGTVRGDYGYYEFTGLSANTEYTFKLAVQGHEECFQTTIGNTTS